MSGWWPEEQWEPPEQASVIHLDGPGRTYLDAKDRDLADEPRQPVGFTTTPGVLWELPDEDIDTDPLLWEGDNT